MNTTNHTPGPWKPCRSHEDYHGPYFDIEPEDQASYQSKPFTSICASNGKTVANAHDLFEFVEADARLMAAAPDLLEHLEMLCNGILHEKVTRDSLKMLARNARAIIASATA